MPQNDPAYGCALRECAPCALSGATATCREGVCAVGSCASGALDCDLSPSTGCECAPANATPRCEGTSCALQACSAGFGDCDGRIETGCEVDLRGDAANCGACGRSCRGGACEGGECKPIVLVQGLIGPQDVAVDDNNAYFTVVGPGNATGSIQRVPLAGGAPVVIASVSKDTRMMVLDRGSGDLYFTVGSATATGAGQGNGIFKVAANAPPNTTPTAVFAANGVEMQQPVGLSTDGATVYWTDQKTGTVLRCSKSSCAMPFTTVGSSGTTTRPSAITTDASNAYWVTASGGRVFRAPKAGGGPDVLLFTSTDNPRDVTEEGGNVFFIAHGAVGGGYIGRTPRTATSPADAVKIAKIDEPRRMVTDSSHVYVTSAEAARGSLVRVPLGAPASTVPEVLASGLTAPFGVALDTGHVYVAVYGSGSSADGSILRIPR